MRPGPAETSLWRGAAPILIVLACLIAFGLGTSAEFVSDDSNAIVTNHWVTGPFDPIGMFRTYSWWGTGRADAPGYRPLTTLSFALNHAGGGLAPRGYHAVNIILHATVCVFVFMLAVALGFSKYAATAGGLLFAVLPIHSEAVIWTVGRAELLAALGFLSALLAGLRYLTTASGVWLAVSASMLVLGAFGKENAVTILAAPLVLVAAESSCATGERATIRRTAIWSVALAAGLVFYLAVRSSAGSLLGATGGNLLDNPLSALPWWQRQLAAVSILGRYLWLSLIPHSLSVDYSFDALGIGPDFWLDRYSIVAVCALALCILVLRKTEGSRRAMIAALLLSLAAYSIVSNTVLVIGAGMAERLFYLPSLGPCLLGGAGFGYLRDRLPRTAATLLAGVLLVYTGVDVQRCDDWSSPVHLFETTVRTVPRSARAHMELASAYGREGRSKQALSEFAKALEIKPDYAAAAYNRGNMLARLGRLEEADASYQRALEAKPNWTSVRYNLALVRRMRGDIAGALATLEEQSGQTVSAATETLHGDLLLAAARPQEAAEAYSKALAAGADASLVLINRGVAYERALGCGAAVKDYRAATLIPFPRRQSFVNAANCLKRLGRPDEAEEVLRRGRVANNPPRR